MVTGVQTCALPIFNKALFDAKLGQWVDMFSAGIIDPAKVTKSALLNAASIAALFLTTEAAVAELPEKKEPIAPPMDY